MARFTPGKVVRLVGLALLILAWVGPWGYDRINVPAEYTCQAPFVRLEGDFCGTPLSGFWLIVLMATELSSLAQSVMAGQSGDIDVWRRLLSIGGTLVLVAPFLSLVWRLISRNPRWPWLHMILSILALAMMAVLLPELVTFRPESLWGPWLYVGAVLLLLVEEALVELRHRRPQRAV